MRDYQFRIITWRATETMFVKSGNAREAMIIAKKYCESKGFLPPVFLSGSKKLSRVINNVKPKTTRKALYIKSKNYEVCKIREDERNERLSRIWRGE